METLRKLLHAECGYRMQEETMDSFVALMDEMELKRGKPLIHYGDTDNHVYIVRQGILQHLYFDGFNERTFSFALPGTLLISYHSFCKGAPSFSQYEACCDSVVMKIPKAKFMDLAHRSHDFAEWMMSMSLEQLFYHEKKRAIMNGTARERFEALVENRPEIIENVSYKIIASYIGITPSYLSTLKKQFARKLKK